MKLDLNCMRDVLLYLEEWLVLDDDLNFHTLDISDLCKGGILLKYHASDIAYTVIKLEEAGFITASIQYVSGQIYWIGISSLTFEGHQFLDTIRPASTWDKILSICDKTELKSIKTIMEISDILLPDTIRNALHS